MAQAATLTIFPPQTCAGTEEFENVANSLQPGDELILEAGVYCQTGGRRLTLNGEPGNPIVIRAADGADVLLTRPDDPGGPQTHNGIEILAAHAEIRGLRFEHGDIGVRILGGTHHLVFENNEIAYTSANAMSLNSGDTDSVTIRGNHIHHTGLYAGGKGSYTVTGEGLYVGCNNAACVASNHVIENNYIHDLSGTLAKNGGGGGNDGIEIKYGSFGNVVRNNVIHTTTLGNAAFPCIFVYGVTDPASQPRNIVEGNVMWDCGEAVQVAADAYIANNLILDSATGITAASHSQVPQLRNVTIVNNTIVNHSDQGLYIRWSRAQNMVLANNAIYNGAGLAVNASGLSHSGVTVSANTVEGDIAADAPGGLLAGGDAALDFASPAARDYWPAAGSLLRGAADARYLPGPLIDFNGSARDGNDGFDVGAYESDGLADNPGWPVVAGFKSVDSGSDCASNPPTLSLLPARQTTATLETAGYTLEIVHGNAACGEALTFSLSAVVPAGWQALLGDPRPTLLAGESVLVELQVTPDAAAADGDYTIDVDAWYGDGGAWLSRQAVLTIDTGGTSTDAPVTGLSATLTRRGNVELRWNAPDDSSLSIARYVVYRDGRELASTKQLRYTDRAVANGAVHRYHVTAIIDGVESAPSNVVTVDTGL